MIKSLKYFHGTGQCPESDYPENLFIAVNVSSSLITKKLLQSFETEQICTLSGVYGDRAAGNPVEVDRLVVKTSDKKISVTVLNRGIAMLASNSEEISRLHRFFEVLQSELTDAG